MYTLGIDIGSSFVKVSLLELRRGKCIASASAPEKEMSIIAENTGWAEQHPQNWWEHFKRAFKTAADQSGIDTRQIAAVGITYQMHGLVALDRDGKVVRPSIIWCDSRAVEIGEQSQKEFGSDYCLNHLLNSPGNFTGSKLKWVKENEPDVFRRIDKIMLPGDYIAWRLSGVVQTTVCGLSEGVLWDFKEEQLAEKWFETADISEDLIPETVPVFGMQAKICSQTADELNLSAGIPISYRAGDQPNNAFSLNVLEPGEVAAAAGTSGVIYGISDKAAGDAQNRVNVFAHVNHSKNNKRLGVLLCINGTGILNSWLRHNIFGMSYQEMNDLAERAPAGSGGLLVYPFGNGAERMLGNAVPGASVRGLFFNNHDRSCLLRAAQEGIAFSFKYGSEILAETGIKTGVLRAGKSNMFLSPLFCQTLANLLDARIELYDTDGALGAARGAAAGAGFYSSLSEAFRNFQCLDVILPDSRQKIIDEIYQIWKRELQF